MRSQESVFSVCDLRDCPELAGEVADRVWKAWWKGKGYPLDYITGRVAESLNPEAIPFAVVAHEDGMLLGTASVIPSDLEERPQYTPWAAAVWVDPQYRGRGIGASLVRSATQAAFDTGIDLVYLCALPERSGFYERLGWRRLEENVGHGGLTVLTCNRSQIPVPIGMSRG
jgi:N-acetylglutamate synthase-like GNAT family acetyltransferase